MHVGEGERGDLGQLALQACAELFHVGRVVAGSDGVDLRSARGGRAARGHATADGAQAGAIEACGVGDFDLHLAVGGAVQGFEIHQVAHSEAIVEEAETAAQNRFGYRAFLVAVERVREGHARGPVVVIGDVILRLPAQAAGEREVLVHLPVILEKSAPLKTLALNA